MRTEMIERFRKAIETIDALGITPEDLIVVDLHSDRVGCQVRDDCFLRLADRLAITELCHYEAAHQHLRFIHQGIEFVAIYYDELDPKYSRRIVSSAELCIGL